MTVIMKVDLVGPRQRGLALGLNEFAGYLSVGGTAWLTGYLASLYSLRPEPFYLGIGFATAGVCFSWLFVHETRGHALLEARHYTTVPAGVPGSSSRSSPPSLREVFVLTFWKDKTLLSCSQVGFVNNLNDAMSWGIYPLFFSFYGLGVEWPPSASSRRSTR